MTLAIKNLTTQNESNLKPKFIETELGKEKLCIQCDEYWPLDDEFWFTYRNKPNKNGERTIGYEAACKCCYNLRYRPERIKNKNKIKSAYEKGLLI
ncbi:hypothetical protein [Acinetobacter sp. YH12023]|uniref:hypothetical protein n=1 Tax=Acinetobacter sp. YH12023 TaxID=2601041 RepID=UPI001C5520E4|nr:hypothetical protein [Acinetobacter sp. YH12023]